MEPLLAILCVILIGSIPTVLYNSSYKNRRKEENSNLIKCTAFVILQCREHLDRIHVQYNKQSNSVYIGFKDDLGSMHNHVLIKPKNIFITSQSKTFEETVDNNVDSVTTVNAIKDFSEHLNRYCTS